MILSVTFQDIVLIAAVSVAVSFTCFLLWLFVTRKAQDNYQAGSFRLLELARANGWYLNQVTNRWENRYEPMRFITAAMVEYSRENYDIKKPR